MQGSFPAGAVAVGVVLAALALVILAGGAFTTTTTIVEDHGPASPFDPPVDSSYAVVMSGVQTASPHFDLFGLKIGSARYAAHIMFISPPGCIPPESGRIEPIGPCDGIPASGEVSGGGTDGNGNTLVIVATPVSYACHQILTPGDRWPHSDPACSGS